MIRLAIAASATTLLLAGVGCRAGSLGPTKQYTQIDLEHGATVRGVLHFAGQAPAPVKIDMAQDPVCAMSPDDMADTVAVHNGELADVLVYIEDGLGNRAYPVTRTPVIIDQKGCRFEPHVSAAMVGQQVEFTNSDPTMHNVHMDPTVAGNSAFDVSQGPNAMPDSRYFHAPELMIPMRCNNHPWMHAYLNVLASPFFAVTGADGSFVIRGLPPGTYTLTAVQAKLGTRSVHFTVGAGGAADESFTF